MKIGFIGLGQMGTAIAGNLIRGGTRADGVEPFARRR